jgi:hypothetical protein
MQIEPLVPALIDAGRLRVDVETGLIYSPLSNTPTKPLGAATLKGYLRICLNVGGRQVHALAHRIVWCAAHGPVPSGMQIDHVNGSKADNRLANLQCVTSRENMKRAAVSGLTNGGWRDGPRDPITGRFLGKARAGRLLDGVEHNGFPCVRP